MKRLVPFLAVACFTQAQLKDAECKMYCRAAAGYDSGLYVELTKSCWCADKISQDRLIEKKLLVPRKNKPSKLEISPVETPREVEVPYALPWEES